MKKFLVLFLVLFLQATTAFAAVQLKVTALQEFQTDNPTQNFSVKIREENTLGKYHLQENSVLNCKVIQIVDPKRGKINATFYVEPVSYTEGSDTICIKEEMYGKYSKTVLSAEELKKIPPSKIIKGAAMMVGNYFIKGLSLGISFTQGVLTNNQGNRLKSGVVNAYEESPLSYISEGEQLNINVGDEFYLIFKLDDEENEPNYTYTMEP